MFTSLNTSRSIIHHNPTVTNFILPVLGMRFVMQSFTGRIQLIIPHLEPDIGQYSELLDTVIRPETYILEQRFVAVWDNNCLSRKLQYSRTLDNTRYCIDYSVTGRFVEFWLFFSSLQKQTIIITEPPISIHNHWEAHPVNLLLYPSNCSLSDCFLWGLWLLIKIVVMLVC